MSLDVLVVDEDQVEAADEAAAQEDLGRLRKFAQKLTMNDLRDGDWFPKLLAFSLHHYVTEFDAAFFREKYPNLPADAIVEERIKLAARYAGIAGGLSASAYTGAVAATIGSGGGASPMTVPGGVASFVVDLASTSQIQLRLAHDIAVLYGVPLDLSDPEDLWKLIRIAFGIKSGEAGGNMVLKGVPAVVRPAVRKVFSGGTLHATKSLPVVGKYLLQRNLIKFAIPAVGVPLTMAVNHWGTKVMGNQARTLFRNEARLVETADRIVASTTDYDALLWVMWLVIRADRRLHGNDSSLMHELSRAVTTVAPQTQAWPSCET